MIKETEAPKRPMTGYMLFINEERAKNKDAKLLAVDLGKKWKALSESEKKSYNDQYKKAKEKYDKYLVEVEGKDLNKSSEKPTAISVSRVRAICGKGSKIKAMANPVYKGLARVVVISLLEIMNRNFS